MALDLESTCASYTFATQPSSEFDPLASWSKTSKSPSLSRDAFTAPPEFDEDGVRQRYDVTLLCGACTGRGMMRRGVLPRINIAISCQLAGESVALTETLPYHRTLRNLTAAEAGVAFSEATHGVITGYPTHGISVSAPPERDGECLARCELEPVARKRLLWITFSTHLADPTSRFVNEGERIFWLICRFAEADAKACVRRLLYAFYEASEAWSRQICVWPALEKATSRVESMRHGEAAMCRVLGLPHAAAGGWLAPNVEDAWNFDCFECDSDSDSESGDLDSSDQIQEATLLLDKLLQSSNPGFRTDLAILEVI